MRRTLTFSLLIMFIVFLVGCKVEKQFHLIDFDSQGGSVIESITVEHETSFTPSELPSREGYIFSGWYLDPNYHFLMAFNAGVTKNLTLYAKWIAEDMVLDENRLDEIISSFISRHESLITSEQEFIEAFFNSINVLEVAQQQITSMLADVSRSVVMVDCYDSEGNLSSGGSGVIYKKDGNNFYVLTNEHVISGYATGDITVTIFSSFGNQTIPTSRVTLLGSSVLHDLAILRFESMLDFRVIEMGSESSLKSGQIVFAIGSPLDLPNTVSMGVISYFNRSMKDSYGMDTLTIQHTASINPGNSGGALVNIHGQLIGINTMSYVNREIGEGINSLHFAVQVDILTQMILELE